ncbi:hypothetical protein [Streptomyces sp. NPDC050982]|uniref:hypothetical protein n=1 Tax=Streptomyces sp. NPDC050982 TaxID=3154746 RepID=UPI0033BFCD29
MARPTMAQRAAIAKRRADAIDLKLAGVDWLAIGRKLAAALLNSDRVAYPLARVPRDDDGGHFRGLRVGLSPCLFPLFGSNARLLSVPGRRIGGWLSNRRRLASPSFSLRPYAHTCPRPASPSPA